MDPDHLLNNPPGGIYEDFSHIAKPRPLYAMQMRLLFTIVAFGIFSFVFGQTYPGLEIALKNEFPKESQKDGRWVFFEDKANIEKIDQPTIKASFPNFDLFQVTLTNYLGWHVNQGNCLILYDSLSTNIILIEPLWYSGPSKAFTNLFIGRKFDNKATLLSFLDGVNELMGIGSVYRFRFTSYSDSLITYDLGYFKGDSYTTGGDGTTSVLRYNEDGVWRKILIDIKDLQILRYTFVNPKTNDKEIIE